MGRLCCLILSTVCLLAGSLPTPGAAQSRPHAAGKEGGRGLPSRARAYVTNERSGTVTVIDTPSDRVVATFKVGARSRGLDVSGDGRTLYVALSHFRGERADADAVLAIDTRDGRVKGRYAVGPDPEGVGVTPDGRRMYVSNEDAGTVTAFDLLKEKVLATLTVGTEPEGVTISPDGRWVYATSETSSTLAIIDARTAGGGSLSRRTAARPTRPNGLSNDVSVIDVAARRVLATIPAGQGPWGVVVGRTPPTR